LHAPHHDLATLRLMPEEWRRRGLTPPETIATMVRNRVDGGGLRLTAHMAEPSYADFFQVIV